MNKNLILRKIEKNLAKIQELELAMVNMCDAELTYKGRQYMKKRIATLNKQNERSEQEILKNAFTDSRALLDDPNMPK